MPHLGEFEQLVLFSLLHLGNDAYGVSIRDEIQERTGRAVSSGAIYTVLGRLEERRMVRSRVEKPQGGPGRPRKYYRLEPAGARALRDAYATVQAMAGGVVGRLEKLAEG